ncbi:hypothetical protein H4S04_007462 [Coemansia sp. S16]|nr:hypothetical protein H4S04_007462 [Coemansia sp. S16]
MFAVGASLVFIPAVSMPAQWFTKNRALAVGIVVAGSGIGGLWLTPATDHMITELGTAWALRITGIIVFAVNSVASLFMRNRLVVKSREKIVDFSIFRDIRFLFIFGGGICGTAAYFTPLFSLPSFAIQVSGKSDDFGTNLITIINAASTVGRIATGQVAASLGNINTLSMCTCLASLSVLVLWLPFQSGGTLVACAIVYGLFCGGFIGLVPVVMAELWGIQRIATIIGLLYIANFAGTMIGAPSSSALLDNVGACSPVSTVLQDDMLSVNSVSEQPPTDVTPKWWASKSLEHKPIEGAYAWTVVASGFAMLMFAMGCVASYGSYQTYYHLHQFPHEPTSTLSWIGTFQFAILNMFGIPAGILCERFDSRLVTFVGGLIMGASLIIASFCNNSVWKLMITQGFMFGMGAALMYIPAVSMPAQWFTKHRALAVGIVISGSGIGGLWLTSATTHMITQLGTAWALRITGIIIFAVNSVASLFMRNRLVVKSREKIVDFTILRDLRFLLIFCGSVCGTLAYFTPLFMLPSFAIQVSGKSDDFGTNLLTIFNAASTVGRIATGQVAASLGNINTLSLCGLIASLSVLVLWLPFQSGGTLVACAIVYGLFCGGFVGLVPVVMAELWGIQRIATIIGLLYISNFIGTMIGAPSSSALLDNVGGGTNYKPSIIFSGVFMMIAFLFFAVLRVSVNRSLIAKV